MSVPASLPGRLCGLVAHQASIPAAGGCFNQGHAVGGATGCAHTAPRRLAGEEAVSGESPGGSAGAFLCVY